MVGAAAVRSAAWVVAIPTIAVTMLSSAAYAGPTASLRYNTPPISKKSIDVWKVKQTNLLGIYTVYAAPAFLRIDCSTGGSLIAKAPDWTIHLFHCKDGRGCEIPYKYWSLNRKNSFNIDSCPRKPTACKIAGIEAKRYTFMLQNFKEDEHGGIYRTSDKKEYVRCAVSVAANKHDLPREPIEIWRHLLEAQARFEIPLEVRNDERFGGSVYAMTTEGQWQEKVPISFFVPPAGLKNEGTPITIYFGTSLEDAAKMIMEMK